MTEAHFERESMNHSFDLSDAGGAWAEGKRMAVRRGAALPHRCLICNAPGDVELHQTFTWLNPGAFLLLLFGILPFVVVAMIFRRRFALRFSLCARHAERRRRGVLLRGAGLVWFLLLPFFLIALLGRTRNGFGTGSEAPELFLLFAVLVGIVAILVGAWMSYTTKAKHIGDVEARFDVPKVFLDSLPSGPPEPPPHW